MNSKTRYAAITLIAATVALTGAYAIAQQGMTGHGPGMMGRMMHGGGAQGMGQGMMPMLSGHDTTAAESRELFEMFANFEAITRTVTNLHDGIRTVTESDDPALAATIVSHVTGMINRVDENRDPKLTIQSPTLDVLFRNRDLIQTTLEPTAKGIVVIQTSTDAETVAALQQHATEVTDMANRGMAALHDSMMSRVFGRQ